MKDRLWVNFYDGSIDIHKSSFWVFEALHKFIYPPKISIFRLFWLDVAVIYHLFLLEMLLPYFFLLAKSIISILGNFLHDSTLWTMGFHSFETMGDSIKCPQSIFQELKLGRDITKSIVSSLQNKNLKNVTWHHFWS